ncbi:hypothetical protein LMG24238_00434 [Paraburkholderia sediminicola]|uniref:Uncharacterized protein n=1 Tax=Paraburkholderia sediminicola TaxID=458836 RepID=A0A6J5A1N4_9BURK|nr:hypothetical protein LMG24238_00434 [Paraburkholderia sediminicola]
MSKPWFADTFATPIHATEKTRPLQRKSLQGAANVALRQKIAGGFNARSWPADVFQIMLALFHIRPIRVFVARHAELAVAIGDRQRQIRLG